MTKMYIQEFAGVAVLDDGSGGGATVFQYPPIATQVLDYTTGAPASAVFNALTKIIQVEVDSICSVRIGVAPVATVTDQRMAANEKQAFALGNTYGGGSGLQISAITNT